MEESNFKIVGKFNSGLASQNGVGRFSIGTARIHLGSDSPMISKFHTNWRMQVISSLDKDRTLEDLHYSSAITISEADFKKLKALLIKNIEEFKAMVRGSKEEGAFCFAVDFFRI